MPGIKNNVMCYGIVIYNKTHTCTKRARARKITPCGHKRGRTCAIFSNIIINNK